MGRGGSFSPFVDHFRWGERLEFDAERADVYEGQVPVYFLHGALHLVVGGSGITWKLRRGAIQTLLDQFGELIAGDPQARPLLVTEGAARDKLRAIEGNAYLAHALPRTMRSVGLPVVMLGAVSASRTITSWMRSTSTRGGHRGVVATWPTTGVGRSPGRDLRAATGQRAVVL